MKPRISKQRRAFECVLHHVWSIAREDSLLHESHRWDSAVDMLYGLRLIAAAEQHEQDVDDCNLLTGIALIHAQDARLTALASSTPVKAVA